MTGYWQKLKGHPGGWPLRRAGAGDERLIRRRRRRIRLDASFTQHIDDGVLDIGLGQGGIAALGGHTADAGDSMIHQGIQSLSEARFPLILGADFGGARRACRMAGHTDLVVDILAGQFDFSARRLGLSDGDTGNRLDAFECGGLLARTIVGGDPAEGSNQVGHHE